MHIYIHAYMYMYMCKYICLYIYIYIHTYIHTLIHIYTYAYIHVHTCTYVYIVHTLHTRPLVCGGCPMEATTATRSTDAPTEILLDVDVTTRRILDQQHRRSVLGLLLPHGTEPRTDASSTRSSRATRPIFPVTRTMSSTSHPDDRRGDEGRHTSRRRARMS